jgi:hypothetical protein
VTVPVLALTGVAGACGSTSTGTGEIPAGDSGTSDGEGPSLTDASRDTKTGPYDSNTGGTKQLGDSCTCANAGPSSSGLCSGTGEECAGSLSCVYDMGSSGKGVCMGERCCSMTAACRTDPSLLQPCAQGTCREATLGFYCQK